MTLLVIPAVIPLIRYIMGLIMCPHVALVTDDSILSNVCVGVSHVWLSFGISVFVPPSKWNFTVSKNPPKQKHVAQ